MSNFERIVKRHRARSTQRGINNVKRLGHNMKMAALFYQKEFAAYERGYDEGYEEANKEIETEMKNQTAIAEKEASNEAQ